MCSARIHNEVEVDGPAAGALGPAQRRAPKSLCLFGAPLDTSNLGVSALGLASLYQIARTGADCSVTLFDFGRGSGPLAVSVDCPGLQVRRCGARQTFRLHLPEAWWRVRVCARLGGLANPAARAIRSADAVLDISGGDSFSDIYGTFRFSSVCLPKLIALENGIPLVLLPQTYGPFRSARARRIAQRIVRGAAAAWARDANSFSVLRELLGGAFDPARHRLGVDVAFGLPAVAPPAENAGLLEPWLADASHPVVGINASGLLMNRPEAAAEQYGLRAGYGEAVVGFARRLLAESDARLLLVPHVVTPPEQFESDVAACRVVAAETGAGEERVRVCPALRDPCEVKWVISRCDWFCGTRMHSAIAALSSGVPAAAIAYSPKTLGVFEGCGQGDHVADPRRLDTGELMERLWASWLGREKARQSLRTALPAVLGKAEQQMREIVAACGIDSGPGAGRP